MESIIQFIGNLDSNKLYVKREDLLPFSFGGNKARKAVHFFSEIDVGSYDCVVTYGSSSSNHCRVVANMAAARNMPCYIISPEEASEATFNSQMMELFGACITVCPVSQVHDTIENTLEMLRNQGKNPYFIPGGGHGNLGTQAYVDCYHEIRNYEQQHHIHFDYIFHASGTGTTQAGLVCGQLINHDDRRIVGISIARKLPRGRDVVLQSIHEYLDAENCTFSSQQIECATNFIDAYIDNGYGEANPGITRTIDDWLLNYGIPLDCTYTGKAVWGMGEYLRSENIAGKHILFIHTGGTPLFFDYLRRA